jgi:DNA-binding NarL/FixJ family response regulator
VAQAEQVHLADQPDRRHRHLTGVNVAASPPWRSRLSARDVSVLRLLADGRSTAGIAEELAYSDSMVKNIIHDLVRQIGAQNRAHAVAMAIRAGVI